MKKLPIAAAALLLGTSAYAMIPSTDPADGTVWTDPYTVEPTTAVEPVYDEAPALQPAAVETWTNAEPVAYTADDNAAELKTVTETSDEVKADIAADAAAKEDTEIAAVDSDADAAADEAEGEPVLDTAVEQLEPVAAQTSAVDEEPVPVEPGVGGPYEGVDTAAADLTPRPAAQNYPACRPGPGDDNCIQLYEPGVRQQLAAWTQPTGGFAGSGETQVAMGGPYEPVGAATADSADLHETAMVGDGVVDTAMGETLKDEVEV